MALTDHFPTKAFDPLLLQAERIFSQRQTRNLLIDPDILGEPGWDILLCAYIAHRKGTALTLDTLAIDVGLRLPITQRWTDFLTSREMLVQSNGVVAISEQAETKLSSMFKKQLREMLEVLAAARPSQSAEEL